jgi:hypothetical protein
VPLARLQLSSLEDRHVPAPLGILAPAYIYPSAGGSDWDRLAADAKYVPITAIANPASGPGDQSNPEYTAAIDKLRAVGGKVIGYVHTSYAARPLKEVEAEVKQYKAWYHLDGIFVDEMSSDADPKHLAYYRSLDNFIHHQSRAWTVVGNPGTNTPASYAKVADTLVLFENGTGYDTTLPPDWQASQPAAKAANIIYDVATTADMRVDVQLAAARNTGWLYVTDLGLLNPYDALPSYWDSLVAAVAENNSGIPGGGLDTTFFVSPKGNDTGPGTFVLPFKTIQHALNVADQPGDTVEVRAGTYHERVSFPNSGTSGNPITLEAYPGEKTIIDGRGIRGGNTAFGNNLVQMIDRSYVRLIGLTLQHATGTANLDASGIHVEGAGTGIEIRNNAIHYIGGVHGMGISVYGNNLNTPIDQLVVDGNTVDHCRPADSETLTLNGNVSNFAITNNLVHDCNNIGIDMIGGEADLFGLPQQTGLPVARNGICTGNTVYNNHAHYGGGFAGGIYVDGGQNITVANNVSYQNDLGIEIGAEHAGYVASGIVVENNVIYRNSQGGLVLGGYDQSVGRVQSCRFVNNTVYDNDTRNTGNGQLWIQWASDNVVTNNIFYAGAGRVLVNSDLGDASNLLNHNLYFTPRIGHAPFTWDGSDYTDLGSFHSGASEDSSSLFADPLFVDAPHRNFRLQAGSPAVDAGSLTAGQYAVTDFTGATRDSKPDIGAYEFFAV